jgi:hypothetical protein
MILTMYYTKHKIISDYDDDGDDDNQGRPLGGASGAIAPGADFEGAPKRRSPTGHTLIRNTVAWCFPHFQTKIVAKYFFLIWLY